MKLNEYYFNNNLNDNHEIVFGITSENIKFVNFSEKSVEYKIELIVEYLESLSF